MLIQGDKKYIPVVVDQGIIWVDKNESLKKGDLYYDNLPVQGIKTFDGYWAQTFNSWKIVASTFDLEGIPLIDLEGEVKKLAVKQIEIEGWGEYTGTSEQTGMFNCFIEGYKSNPAKYTEEDMREAIRLAQSQTWDGESKRTYSKPKFSTEEILDSLKSIQVDKFFKVKITQ